MVLLHHKPAAPLSNFVDCMWHYEYDGAPHRVERMLPSGDMGIILSLRDRKFQIGGKSLPGAIISGAHSEYFTLDTAQQAYTLGIQFKPGGAIPFLNMPSGELQAKHVALNEVWGGLAEELHERVLGAKSAKARFRIVEETLLVKLDSRDPHPAVTYALREIERTHNIEALAAGINISPKRFADVFRNEVGLTPKLFCRVRRFQQVLRRLNEGTRVEWADFALANGYYDQSHFIHDFQAFSGMNPSSYAPREPGYLNHVPLD